MGEPWAESELGENRADANLVDCSVGAMLPVFGVLVVEGRFGWN